MYEYLKKSLPSCSVAATADTRKNKPNARKQTKKKCLIHFMEKNNNLQKWNKINKHKTIANRFAKFQNSSSL